MFKLRKTRQKLALSLTHWAPFVRPLKGLGIKIDVCENPMVYASTRDWSRLYGAIRSETERAPALSVPALTSECLWEHSRCLSSACIVVGAVTVTPAENGFVSPLSDSSPSPSPRKHFKKKKNSQCRRTTVSSSKRTFANPSKFLWTLRSTD